MTKTPIAVEIGSQFLKLVAVDDQKAGSPAIQTIVVEPIATLTDVNIVKLLSDILKKKDLKARSAVICLPRNSVTVRNLHLPSKEKAEIDQMISLHIGRIVPYRKDEITFDYKFIGTDAMGYSKEVLAIVHNGLVRRHFNILESAGLAVEKIELSSYGAWQWILNCCKQELKKGELQILIDVDSSFVDFLVFDTDNLLFTRNISIEVKDDAIAESDITKLVGEVRQSLVIFYKEELNKKPVKIFISGAAASGGLEAVFEKEFGIPSGRIPPPQKGMSKDIPPSVSLTAVTEIALEDSHNRIGFVLPEMHIRKSLKEKTKEYTILASLLVYLLMVVMGFFWMRFHAENAYLKKLTDRNKLIEKDIGAILSESTKVEFVKKFVNARKAPLQVMYELQFIMPQEISLTFTGVDESGKVTLRGEGAQLSDVFKFVTMLENSKYFNGVTTRYTRTKNVRGREITDFELFFNFGVEA